MEFENAEDLRRNREAYLLHLLDYVLQDRARIAQNDVKRYQEATKDVLSLENVFDMARQQESQGEDEEEDEEENSDIDTPDEEEEVEEESKQKKGKKTEKPWSQLELDPDGYL